MYVALQLHILKNHAVNAHADPGLALGRLDVNIAGAAFNGALCQTVEQMDNGCFFFHVIQFRQVQIIKFRRAKSRVRIFCRLSGAHLCIVIRNSLVQRLFFAQKDPEVTSGLLAHFLQGKIIQRIIGHQHHCAVLYLQREEQILFRKLFVHHRNRFQIGRSGRHIHNFQLKPAGKRLQHLLFRHEIQFNQNLTDPPVPVLFLVDQSLLHLLLVHIATFFQYLPDSQICFQNIPPPVLLFKDSSRTYRYPAQNGHPSPQALPAPVPGKPSCPCPWSGSG